MMASNDSSPPNGRMQIYLAKRLTELMDRTKCLIRQFNGQRIFGPPMNWVGPPPPKGSEVFVGKVPRDMFEDELVPLFSTVGPVYELRLMMDLSGTNRGYAFVTYADPETAERAVLDLDNIEIRPGRKIGVCISVDNCRLFVGGIPKHLDRDDIFRTFADHTHGVKDVIVYSDYNDRSLNRGFAFIEYESHRAAAMARRELIPTSKLNLWNAELKVDWAEPEAAVDPKVMQRWRRHRRRYKSKSNERSLHKRGARVKIRSCRKNGMYRCQRCDRVVYVKGLVDTDIKNFCKRAKHGSDRLDSENEYLNGEVTVLYARNLAARTTEEELLVLFSFSGCFHVTKVKKIRDFAFIHFHVRDEAEYALRQLNKIILHDSIVEVTWAKPPECSVRRQSRCTVEGYRSYPRHPQSSNGCNLNGYVTPPPLDAPRDVGLANGSIPGTLKNTYKGPKSVFNKYPMIFSAICHEKNWGEPVFQTTAVTYHPNELAEFKCKLTVPALTISVEETSFGIDDAKSKAAYIMMRRLGICGSHDMLSSVPSIQNSLTHSDSDLAYLQNYFSSVSLNDIGQGDGSDFQTSSSSGVKDVASNGHNSPNDSNVLSNGHGTSNSPNFLGNGRGISNGSSFLSNRSNIVSGLNFVGRESNASNSSDFLCNEPSTSNVPNFLGNNDSIASNSSNFTSNGVTLPRSPDFTSNGYVMPNVPYFVADRRSCTPIGSNFASTESNTNGVSRFSNVIRRRYLDSSLVPLVPIAASVGTGLDTPIDSNSNGSSSSNGSSTSNDARYVDNFGARIANFLNSSSSSIAQSSSSNRDNAANSTSAASSVASTVDASSITSADNLARPMSLFQPNSVDMSQMLRNIIGMANVENNNI